MNDRPRVLLTIESTCDETASAIIAEDGKILASEVASQTELHEAFSGVVPEIAARAHLERLLPIIDRVIKRSGIEVSDLKAIAVATQPGLPGSLLVGLSMAKALCLAWEKPLVAINHIHAHIYACQMASPAPVFPCVGFVVSGGHTNLYRCRDASDWEYLGGTIDDAAGEAFDKVAVMLGLPFPGGPNLSHLAESGDANRYQFPRPMIHDTKRLDLSFSGLKTAVRYQLVGAGKQQFQDLKLDLQTKADIAASFQQAVIDCLVTKALQALRFSGMKRLCVGGGVAGNRQFRIQLGEACKRHKIELHIAPAELCTDNADMGAIAWEKVRLGQFDALTIDARPGLQRRPHQRDSI